MKRINVIVSAALISAAMTVPTMAAPIQKVNNFKFNNSISASLNDSIIKNILGNDCITGEDIIKDYIYKLCGNNGNGGNNGNTGNNGSTGGNENNGNNGSTGGNENNGNNGSTGNSGNNGNNGSTGDSGNNGNNGSTGGNENNGNNGNTGDSGNNGNNGSSSGYNESYEAKVIELVNAERTSRGLSALSMSSEASKAADVRAKEIVTKFSHTRPDGSSCFTVLSQMGVSYKKAGENIAYGQNSPEEVVNAWMNSPSHRENILSTGFNEIGVSSYKVGSTIYWTQMFLGR